MIENVKQYVSAYATLDAPIPYKDLLIYPILVKNYYEFNIYSDILHIEKNDIQDLNVIQMTYLDFVLDYLIQDNRIIDEKNKYTMGQFYGVKFVQILALCFKIKPEEIKAFKQGGQNKLYIKDTLITAQDFDEIRRIIMYQNIYGYSDEYVNPDIKKAMEEYYSIKNQGLTIPDLEDKMAELTAMTGILKRDILEMTYREFENVFDASTSRLEYQISRTAELSGMVKFDKPIKHWIYNRKRNKYEDAFTSYKEFRKKI